ncbi:MAG: glycosyltransferase N-terminal domain-containing protein [Planctomycetota bacterium]
MGLGRDILYATGALAASPIWGASLLRTGKWRTDWPGKFGRTGGDLPPDPGVKTLLIHGVSVGEISLIRNLVKQLETVPNLRLVIATTTNTGFARATALYAPRHRVVRFPFDFSFAVRRFLDSLGPDAVALVELEVWPNFMDACTRRGLPVAVINGRLTERSYRGYRRIAPLIRPAFRQLAAAAVQTPAYAQRFRDIGVPADRVRVLDTMKWDTAVIEDAVDGSEALAEAMHIDPQRPLIVAGSTAPGEERLLIDACPSDAQVLLAPRKPEWFEAVLKHAPHAVRRTAPPVRPPVLNPDQKHVFLLDTIGELRVAYSLADICVIGRSFTGELYGSDMMEPIALGKPTVIGPHHADFAQTMAALKEAGGIVVAEDPADAIQELLQNASRAAELAEAGRRVILSHQGATAHHATLLLDLLGLPPGPNVTPNPI